MMRHEAWFAGVDWASEAHHVRVVGDDGSKRAERIFRHGGAGLAEMADWIANRCGGAAPEDIPVAIEIPHGPVVESLMDHGFAVYSINPKQLDRFRDRHSPAGAKDDSLDARVLADALRTDLQHFRRIDPVDPVVVELRRGRGSTRSSRETARACRTACGSGCGASIRRSSMRSEAWSSPGSSIFGPRCRRPRGPGASSAGLSRAFSSATGSGGSRPPNSRKSSAPRPSPSRQEPPRSRSPTSEASPNASASYTANSPRPSGRSPA